MLKKTADPFGLSPAHFVIRASVKSRPLVRSLRSLKRKMHGLKSDKWYKTVSVGFWESEV